MVIRRSGGRRRAAGMIATPARIEPCFFEDDVYNFVNRASARTATARTPRSSDVRAVLANHFR